MRKLMSMIALAAVLLLSFGVPAWAGEEGKSVEVTTFTQMKKALEDPDVSEVNLKVLYENMEHTECLYPQKVGEHGITVKGEKKLNIGRGQYRLYFRESTVDKTGFDSLFYLADHAKLTISGEGRFEYCPAPRSEQADNCMFRVYTGGTLEIADDFRGVFIVSSYHNNNVDACSVFTLGEYSMLKVGKCEETWFVTRPSQTAMAQSGKKSGVIYDPSGGITYITLLGGVFYPAEGQYFLLNKYSSAPSDTTFFKNVTVIDNVSKAEDAHLFNNRGSFPPYSAYIKESTENYNYTYVELNTTSFNGELEEPSSIYLSPSEEYALDVKPFMSIYLKGMDIYIKRPVDEDYPQIPEFSTNDLRKEHVWDGLKGTEKPSRRILKMVFRYKWYDMEWSTEREIYVYTSKPYTEEDPYIVTDYDDLRRALCNPVIKYIKMASGWVPALTAANPLTVENAVQKYRGTGDIKELDKAIKEYAYCHSGSGDVSKYLGYPLSRCALTVVGEKHLELDEDLELMAAPNRGPVFQEWQGEGVLFGLDLYNSDLTITGKGMLTWEGNSKADRALSGAIRVGYNSSLCLEGTGITARRNVMDVNLNNDGYACAVYAAGEGSTVTVKKGLYSGGAYGVKGYKESPAEYPSSVENAAIIAGKDADISIFSGTFTDSYLGEAQDNGAYPGTDYARGCAGLGILYDKSALKTLPKKIEIRSGEFPTGIRKFAMNGTSSFSFEGQDADYIKANLLYYLSDFEAVDTIIKEPGSGISFDGAKISGPATIDDIEINSHYTAPKEGIDAATETIINSAAGWSIVDTDVYWNIKDADGNVEGMIRKSAPAKFVAGKYYELVLPIEATNYHMFALDDKDDPRIKATLDKKPLEVRKVDGEDPGLKLELVYDFGKCNSSVITEVGVRLLQDAVHGTSPEESAMTSGTGYSLSEMTWYVKDDNNKWQLLEYANDYGRQTYFEYGHEYKANFFFEADTGNGFRFSVPENTVEPKTVTFSLNGNKPRAYNSGADNYDLGDFDSIWFNNNIIEVKKKNITEIKLGGLTAPTPGKQPDFSVQSLGQDFYVTEADSVKWSDSLGNELTSTSRFLPGETYTATVSVVPVKNEAGDSVAQFDAAAKAYINGAKAEIYTGVSGADRVLVKISRVCNDRAGTAISAVSAKIDEAAADTMMAVRAELPEEAPYMVMGIDWYGRIKGEERLLTTADRFERGQSYEARIKLAPNRNYYFSEDNLGLLTVSALVNDEIAKVDGDAEGITLYRSMSVPREPVEAPRVVTDFDETGRSFKVDFVCDTEGADVYYTTDGSDPDRNSVKFVWGQPIYLTEEDAKDGVIKIRCIAGKDPEQYIDSEETVELLDFGTEKKVSFDPNGGVGEMDMVYTKGGQFQLPKCYFVPPEGKEFDIWEKGKDTGIYYAPGDYAVTDSDVTVYALWKDIDQEGDEEEVFFDPGEGGGSMDPVKPDENNKIILPECNMTAPEGKEFNCWIVNGENYKPGDVIEVTKNITIIALWKDKEPGGQGGGNVSDNSISGNGVSENTVTPDKVPPMENSAFAADDDNLAPGIGFKKITTMDIFFDNVEKSGVDPMNLKMTVIKGSKLYTPSVTKSITVSSKKEVRYKIFKATRVGQVIPKKNGWAEIQHYNKTYRVYFRVETPKAQKQYKKLAKGSVESVTYSPQQLFGTHIIPTSFEAVSKAGQVTKNPDGTITITPKADDKIKITYTYLNKKYKMTITVK